MDGCLGAGRSLADGGVRRYPELVATLLVQVVHVVAHLYGVHLNIIISTPEPRTKKVFTG